MIEEWRNVPGYEGLYEVSNLGRVKNIKTERILKPGKNNLGYLQVALYKNGLQKTVKVHRLVALAFLSNPQNLHEINHKDEDKTNNTVENLEWCTHEYNMNYGTRIERLYKPVLQFDLLGNFIREWPSMIKVYEELGISRGNISSCCSGKLKTVGGFVWRFK